MKKIIFEIETMFSGTKGLDQYVEKLGFAVENNSKIIGIGAGRMGYSLRAHVMRLSHLGLNTYFIGDTSLPRIDEKSVVIINSSSGETPTNILYTQQASMAGSFIISFTSNRQSTIAGLSDLVIEYPVIETHQLMKTIYEQFTYLLFDYAIEELVRKLDLNRNFITKNHSILE